MVIGDPTAASAYAIMSSWYRRSSARRSSRSGSRMRSRPTGAALPHLAGCGQLGPDRHAHARNARRVLRAPERRRGRGGRARMRAGDCAAPCRCGAESWQARGDHRDPERRRNGSHDDARHRDRGIVCGGARSPSARVPCDLSSLILCVKCGGSDYTSGLAANPALGRVADRLVDAGGTAVLGEIAEIMGAEHLLAARAASPGAGCAAGADHQPCRS